VAHLNTRRTRSMRWLTTDSQVRKATFCGAGLYPGWMRSKGTASELEAIRRRAVKQVFGGQTQVAVARGLGVHPVTVAKWLARHRADGDVG